MQLCVNYLEHLKIDTISKIPLCSVMSYQTNLNISRMNKEMKFCIRKMLLCQFKCSFKCNHKNWGEISLHKHFKCDLWKKLCYCEIKRAVEILEILFLFCMFKGSW